MRPDTSSLTDISTHSGNPRVPTGLMRMAFGRSLLEAWVWLAALVSLALLDPKGDHLFTLCPLANLELPFCPGCGLGRSIAYLFHGDVGRSLAAHPLGIPATFILGARIINMFKINLMHYGKSH